MKYLDVAGTVEVMRDEGLRYGGEIAAEMMPDADTSGWQKIVARIYDSEKMYNLIAGGFSEELGSTDLQPLLAYFGSAHGQEIIKLELAARRAFLDPGVEAVALAQFEKLEKIDAPLLAEIEQMIADSDLVEFNVMGALNSNLMFYRGLNDGGAYELTEQEILSDVWTQEADIRKDTEEWMYAFLVMAYQPLEVDKLQSYSALYRTEEGRDLNRAMFAAFDRMYEEVSYLLGLAVAQYLQSEKL